MTPTCVHQQRQEFNADCIFCREIQQKEGEKDLNASDGLPTTDLFGEVISTYTDREAVEDGFLVALAGPGPVNRVTRAVFDHFTQVMGPGVTNITPLMDAIRDMLTVEANDGWRTGAFQGKALWLIPNEVGGFTLMFPEDY